MDLLDRQDLQPRRRQLDRQRNPVEPPAHLGNGAGVVARDRERGINGRRALDQQTDGLVLQEIVGDGTLRSGRAA